MSVWSSDSQRLDLYKSIWQLGPKMFSQIVTKPPSAYLECNSDMVSQAFEESWDAVAAECAWPVVDDDIELPEDEIPYYTAVKHWHTGLPAVYRIIRMIRDGLFNLRPSYDRDAAQDALDNFLKLMAPSTQINSRRFVERAAQRDMSYDKLQHSFEDASESFKFLRVIAKPHQDAPEIIDPVKFFGPGIQPLAGFGYKDVHVFRGREGYNSEGFVLAKIHMSYLVGACARIANLIDYYTRSYNKAEVLSCMEWVNYTIDQAGNARGLNAQIVAKAFAKVRTVFQMELLDSEFTVAVDGERADYISDRLHQIVPLDEALDKLRAMGPVMAMEVVHTYKWMPPPDFDATRIPYGIKKLHNNHRSSGLSKDADPKTKELWDRIVEERKANLVYAFKRHYGRWPDTMDVRGPTFTRQELLDWDPTGCLVYHQMGNDIVTQIKDKTTVAQSKAKELDMKTKAAEKSYLLWYMAEGHNVDTVTDLQSFAQGNITEDNFVRVAYKPEAQKPDSRLFYMAPPIQRTLLGELEANLSNVAKYYPCSLMGKNTADKLRLCASVMDLHGEIDAVPAGVDVTIYILTFDLAKFSPQSNPEVTENYHEWWAVAYSVPAIASLYRIGCTSDIIHTTSGLRYEWKNPGVDLEGFRGKMMTMFHVDLLSTAARIGRERGLIAGKSDLVVFIDDGAIKIAATGRGEEARANAAAFMEVMQEVYAAAGQACKPSKTVVSRKGGEILAAFYYRGMKMPQGVKALMRLMPDYENAAATISEENDQLYATAQGAVKDGADWVVTYTMMAHAIIKNVHRWCRRSMSVVSPVDLALKMITPKSFGGLGVTSLQALTTNASSNATSEGLAMMNRMVRTYPEYRMYVIRLMRLGVVVRDNLSILRDPLRVRINTPVIIENRLQMKVVKWLEDNATQFSRFLASYRDESLRDHATAVADALFEGGVINVPLLERSWKATPLAYVESVVGKFKRSATIINLIGYSAMNAIRRENMKDLKTILGI